VSTISRRGSFLLGWTRSIEAVGNFLPCYLMTEAKPVSEMTDLEKTYDDGLRPKILTAFMTTQHRQKHSDLVPFCVYRVAVQVHINDTTNNGYEVGCLLGCCAV
jgi:hypothetical protein